jgi:anti-sigma B factor antagonist
MTETVTAITILKAPADFDVYTAPGFRAAVVKAVQTGHYRIVVDLSETTDIDMTGLGVLVGALRRATAHDGWVRLAGPGESVAKCLHLTGMTKIFVIADTVEAAINHETQGATP